MIFHLQIYIVFIIAVHNSFSSRKNLEIEYKQLFCFLLPMYGRESIAFQSNFLSGYLMDLQVLRSTESEITFLTADLSLSLSLSLYVCVSVCVSVISITQKQITAETSNLVFYICIIYRCCLKLFIKTEQKLCVQGYKKEL